MAAESAISFAALEDQAERIMRVFAEAGYERVAPAFIQPANIFLDRIGEALRSRTYVFTDPDGEELCLRPDLTIPTCRLYLERHPTSRPPARYAYNGPAFRYQPGGPDVARPREFRQAGLECFGIADREQADVEVLALVLEAMHKVGLTNFQLRIGDLGLFRAILGQLPIRQRWRERLMNSFWRPENFHEALRNLATHRSRLTDPEIADLAWSLDADDTRAAEKQVAAFLESKNIPMLGARRLEEITERLLDDAADMHAEPLPGSMVQLVENYLSIQGKPTAALKQMAQLMQDGTVKLSEQLHDCHRRMELMTQAGISLKNVVFDADFGRQLEYYSGFVFQIELPGRGISGQIAGGGRYDGLMAAIGAEVDVPTIGSAIHTERLLAAKGSAT
jgi:ATP phosphoribosyltransferase regulatory subunit